MTHSTVREALPLLALLVLSHAVARCAWTARLPSVTLAFLPALGGGLLAAELALFGVVHAPWTPLSLLAPWVLIAALRYRGFGRAVAGDAAVLRRLGAELVAGGPLAVACAAATLAVWGLGLVAQVSLPLVGWDALGLWMYKAAIYYREHSFSVAPFAAEVVRKAEYPPLYPGLVDVVYVLAGGIRDFAGKALDAFFLPVLAATLVGVVRPILGTRWAAIFALLGVTCPLFIPFTASPIELGYADFALAVLIGVAVAQLVAVERGSAVAAGPAVAAAAMAALTKQEGLVVFGGVLVATLALRTGRAGLRTPSGALLASGGGLAVAAWQGYLRTLGLHSAYTASGLGSIGEIPGRVLLVLQVAARVVRDTPDFMWVAAAAVLVLGLLAWRRGPGRVAALVLAVQLAGYVAAYAVTPYDLQWQLNTSIDRLMTQAVPALMVLLAVAVGNREGRAPQAEPDPREIAYSTSR